VWETVWEVGIILLLIAVNGLLAMSELAIVSSRRARLQQWAEEKRFGAAAALRLAEHPERFLATVQVGITLIAIISGAFGGATIGEMLEEALRARGVPPAQAETWGVVMVVVAVTFLSVVVGELLPKSAALAFREKAAVIVAGPMAFLARLAAPLVALLTVSTRGLVFLLRIRPSEEPPVTEQEINILMQEGTRAGVFVRTEQQLIESVLELDNHLVAALMTPRTEMPWLSRADDEETLRRKLAEGNDVYPVLDESQETAIGVLDSADLLRELAAGDRLRLPEMLRPATYVPENITALAALQLLADQHARAGLVVDEYGTHIGLVTMARLMQHIAREVPQEPHEPRLVRREDGSWLVDGLMPYQALFEQVGGNQVSVSFAGYHTIGGLAMATLGRIPRAGDRFELGPLYCEVVDMDGHRVDKLIVRITPPTPA